MSSAHTFRSFSSPALRVPQARPDMTRIRELASKVTSLAHLDEMLMDITNVQKRAAVRKFLIPYLPFPVSADAE